MNNKSKKGFSLVELAIVIAVIGFILTAVLASDIIIKQAKYTMLKRTLGSVTDKVNQYKAIMGSLPGDENYQTCSASSVNRKLACGTSTDAIYSTGTDGTLYDKPNTNELFLSTTNVLSGTGMIGSCKQIIQLSRFMSRLGYFSAPKSDLNTIDAQTGFTAGYECEATANFFPKSSESNKNLIIFSFLKSSEDQRISVLYMDKASFAGLDSALYVASVKGYKDSQPTAGNLYDGAYDRGFAKGFDLKYDDGTPTSGKILGIGNTRFGAKAQVGNTCLYTKDNTKDPTNFCNIAILIG